MAGKTAAKAATVQDAPAAAPAGGAVVLPAATADGFGGPTVFAAFKHLDVADPDD